MLLGNIFDTVNIQSMMLVIGSINLEPCFAFLLAVSDIPLNLVLFYDV